MRAPACRIAVLSAQPIARPKISYMVSPPAVTLAGSCRQKVGHWTTLNAREFEWDEVKNLHAWKAEVSASNLLPEYLLTRTALPN